MLLKINLVWTRFTSDAVNTDNLNSPIAAVERANNKISKRISSAHSWSGYRRDLTMLHLHSNQVLAHAELPIFA